MASPPPFPVEDNTDEDFFDNLVEDEGDGAGSGPGNGDNVDTHDAQAFAKLRIGEGGSIGGDGGSDSVVDSAGGSSINNGEQDGVVSSSTLNDNVGEKESTAVESIETSDPRSMVESTGDTMGAVGPSDKDDDQSKDPNEGAGVKVVQWSAFGSDSVFDNGAGEGSYSDFFSEIDDSSADPFGGIPSNPVAQSDKDVGVSSNPDSISYKYSQDAVYPQPSVSTSEETTITQDVSNQQTLSAEYNYGQEVGNQQTGVSADAQDPNSIEYWESLYPGWKYDPSTGQWHQVEGSDVTASAQESYESNSHVRHNSEVYLQQTGQSTVENVTVGSANGSLGYWDQITQATTSYPAHMVFDPQYPGWYYDTISQEWKSLESYNAHASNAANVDYSLQTKNENAANGNYNLDQSHMSYGQQGQVGYYRQHEGQFGSWGGGVHNINAGGMNMWRPDSVSKETALSSSVNTQTRNGHNGYWNNSTESRAGSNVAVSKASTVYEPPSHGIDASKGVSGYGSFSSTENLSQLQNQHYREHNHFQQSSFSGDGGPNLMNFSQQPHQNGVPFNSATVENRSSAGRPAHALVTFGFGGKILVVKSQDSSFAQSSYGTQDATGGTINVLNLTDVVISRNDGTSLGLGAAEYFHSLCQQCFPGPLVSGNVGSKELNKWIDDKVASLSTQNMDYRRGEVLKMLFSLLKIACQCYGKLRSPFGTDNAMKENDCPESALAKLFASSQRDGTQYSRYEALNQCLQTLPSEGQIQAAAVEVQKLLVSGRKIDALQCAQEGQLWGPAIVIAAQLGDQYYADTVKQMAVHQLISGCPLRTLCLLIAGKPAEVFSGPTATNDQPSGFSMSQTEQTGLRSMLDQWEENLAIITANRTKGDELVITHLGDCLWRERSEVTAAHICYLVAEQTIESYSDSARLCLVGADHWKYPRTYASPEAIQRTELYEYGKVLGNSQYILLPFQPYKLIYAHMLAEVGKLSDSLKYCQAISKSLKTGRGPEVDAWRQLVSSLEDRIKIHQQGGFVANLAPAKLVGKLLNLFDSTAHRVVGGLPPPVPSHSNGHHFEHDHQSRAARVSTSQSTMAMSSLMSSASVEPITEWGGSNRKSMHNRSISEPDIGRIPRKGDSPGKPNSSDSQDNSSATGGASRFGRFGSQLFQKTFGLVMRSRSDRQAKLGEENKFYYDEKLKRWVEQGVEPAAEEPALAPPPTASAFMNGKLDHNIDGSGDGSVQCNDESEFKSPSPTERSSGIPPMPPNTNHFSARGRMGVRARYVDTFNKGGGTPTNLFQSPSVPAAKPAASSAKFFIPTPSVVGDEAVQTAESTEAILADENSSVSDVNRTQSPPLFPASTIQRYPSVDNISNQRWGMAANGNDSVPPHSALRSRRTASWGGGSFPDPSAYCNASSSKPLGEALGFPYVQSDHPASQFTSKCGSSVDDLQEVEL